MKRRNDRRKKIVIVLALCCCVGCTMAMMTTNDEVDLDELVQEVIREFPPRPIGIRDGWVKKSGIGRKEYVGIEKNEKEKEVDRHTNTPKESNLDVSVPEYFSSRYEWSDFEFEQEQKQEENSELASPSDSSVPEYFPPSRYDDEWSDVEFEQEQKENLPTPSDSNARSVDEFIGMFFGPNFDVMAFDLCQDVPLCRGGFLPFGSTSLHGYYSL